MVFQVVSGDCDDDDFWTSVLSVELIQDGIDQNQ